VAILAIRPGVAQPFAVTGTPKQQQKQQQQNRQRRLSAALRDNLQRRKAQARGRHAAEDGRSSETHDSAGIATDKRKD
jgi:nitric oxide reductase activation protein